MKKIDKYQVISTTKGDTGQSRNYSNELLDKTDILFDTIGSIDELSSLLGVVYHHSGFKHEIKMIQQDLQNIMSVIATNINDKNMSKLIKISDEDINDLEEFEEKILEECNIEPKFVLPGSDSNVEGAYLDLARSFTRRVERHVIRFKVEKKRNDLDLIIKYLNRLSDLLFIMARSND